MLKVIITVKTNDEGVTAACLVMEPEGKVTRMEDNIAQAVKMGAMHALKWMAKEHGNATMVDCLKGSNTSKSMRKKYGV